MAIFDDENNNQSTGSPFTRSTTSRTSSMDGTKEGNIHIGSGVSVNGEINAPNEVIVNGKHTGKVAAGKISVKNGGGVDGETAVETAEIEGNYDGNLQVAGTLSVSSSSFTNLIFDFWKSSSDISAIVPLIFPPKAISKSLYLISPFAIPEEETDNVPATCKLPS